MRSVFVSSAILAFAASVLGQAATSGFDVFTSIVQDQNIPAGSSFDVAWTPSTTYPGTVSLILLEGTDSTHLQLGPTVAGNITNSGKFSWTVPASQAATYGFKIMLDSDNSIFQYSFPFHITGGSTTGSSTGTTTVSISLASTYTSNSTSSTVSTSATITTSTSSNSTTPTTVKTTSSTASATGKTTTSSTSSSASPTKSASAAAANIVSGGMAVIGGLVVALAL